MIQKENAKCIAYRRIAYTQFRDFSTVASVKRRNQFNCTHCLFEMVEIIFLRSIVNVFREKERL